MARPRNLDPPPAWIALALTPVAGLGHLVLGRARRGLGLFVGVTASVNLAILSSVAAVPPFDTWTLRVGAALTLGLTAFSVLDVFRIGIWARLPRIRERRRACLTSAIDAWIGGDVEGAREDFTRMLEIDPADPAALLYLASLERRAGHPGLAERHARRALSADPDNPYHPEIEREIAIARESRRDR